MATILMSVLLVVVVQPCLWAMVTSQESTLKLFRLEIGKEIVPENSLACHAAWSMFFILLLDANVIPPPNIKTMFLLLVAAILLPMLIHPRVELATHLTQYTVMVLHFV